ncbi:MAG: ImmA/IrrE family metallo-endopeptidase, partial [Hymenobacter sp.]
FNENVDGYSFHTNSGMPVIYVNREVDLDRLRFNIAHELGHLVMHSDCLPDAEREKEAHRFAAEFLMPGHEIHDQLINLKIEGLMALKARWGCSMAALVQRARHLGLLGEERYKSMLIGLSPYRKKEPVDLAKHGFIEEPQLLGMMMQYHLDEVGMTTTQIRDMLHLSDVDFSKLMLTLGLGSGGMFISHR